MVFPSRLPSPLGGQSREGVAGTIWVAIRGGTVASAAVPSFDYNNSSGSAIGVGDDFDCGDMSTHDFDEQ
ncbi:hypothetical protein CERZMDRAFT_90435 [Cercospora zeae-maydis SCOH1-5]|uniref:Uncharacterized protein n=1 Tax=Cercospora zeae-maydis SCOH1-5 TaxID=717836 RepID=A0A6A6FIT5_9PEZI|nr:hypothetical protein CERZMDRAFT_90435 [Cercospora zeae-maydis SCOH1-5]